ncbi:hypothetical protein BH23ACT7_BH23ACT7_23460 [soil metagenome]
MALCPGRWRTPSTTACLPAIRPMPLTGSLSHPSRRPGQPRNCACSSNPLGLTGCSRCGGCRHHRAAPGRARRPALARRRLPRRADRGRPAARQGRRDRGGRTDEDEAQPPTGVAGRRHHRSAAPAPRGPGQGEGAAGRRVRRRRPRLLPARRIGFAPRPRHAALPRARPAGGSAEDKAAWPPSLPRHLDAARRRAPKVVQERLGHSSIAITLDTYSHAIPAMQEDAASRVARIVDQEETDEHDRRPSGDAGGEEPEE